MELRDRKIIQNTGNLPAYNDSKEPEKLLHLPGKDAIPGMVTNGINLIGNTVNAFGPVKSSSDILAESGTSVGQGAGFTYQKQNSVDVGAQMDELGKQNTANTLQTAAAGASMGSAFGPIGAGIGGVVGGAVGFIGGLFRNSKMADRIKKAQIQAINNNNYALASAQSNYLTNDYNAKHDNTQNDLLYHAEEGKSPVDYTMQQSGFIKKNGKWVFDGHAMLSNGEVKFHTDKLGRVTDYERIGKGKDNNDTVKVKLGNTPEEYAHTGVVSNHNGASDYAMATGDMYGGIEIGQQSKNQDIMIDLPTIKQLQYGSFNKKNGILMAKEGKLPKYNTSKQSWTTLNPLSGLAIPTAEWIKNNRTDFDSYNNQPFPEEKISQARAAKARGVGQETQPEYNSKRPSSLVPGLLGALGLATAYSMMPDKNLGSADTQVSNPYARQALSTLAGLRSNKYAQMQEAREAEARNIYMFSRSGYHGAHQYLAGVAGDAALQKLYANVLANSNKEDNTYFSNWASSALNVGHNQAQWDQYHLNNKYDTYARSHGAFTKNRNNVLSEMFKMPQWAYQQILNNNLSYDTLALYNKDYELRRNLLKG